MFKHEFQGGPFLEILSIQGKESASKYNSHGLVKKYFDKEVKSYILSLEGDAAQSKVCIPKNEKQGLYILQRYLVLQLLIPLGAPFSIEVVAIDSNDQKRRLLISTSHKEICVTSFHVKIPLILHSRGTWGNLCLDVKSFVEDTFKSCTYKAIDRITVTANCRLRKIISMKNQLQDTTGVNESIDINEQDFCDTETAGRMLQLNASGDTKSSINQVCNIQRLLRADIKLRQSSGLGGKLLSRESSDFTPTHIAFGTRSTVPKSPHKNAVSHQSGNTATGDRSHSASSTTSSIGSSGKMEEKSSDMEAGPQVEVQRLPFQPRPPKQTSGFRKRRPNPRIRMSDSPVLGKKLSDSNVQQEKEAASSENGSNDLDIGTVLKQTNIGSRGENPRDPVVIPTGDYLSTSDGLKDINNNNELKNDYYDHDNIGSTVPHEASSSDISADKNIGVGNTVDHLASGNADGGLVMGNSADVEDYLREMKESEDLLSGKSLSDSFNNSHGSELTSSYQDDHVFLYTSQPKRPSKSQRLQSSADGTSIAPGLNAQRNGARTPPHVIVTELRTASDRNSSHGSYKSAGFASLESDFMRDSSDTDEEEPLDRFHKLGRNQRLSPVPNSRLSPAPARRDKLNSGSKSRTPVPTKMDNDSEKQLSCASDSMSWIYDSDTSQKLSGSGSTRNSLDVHNESGYHEDAFVEFNNNVNSRLSKTIQPDERLNAVLSNDGELGGDSDDYLTDDSDETSFSVWQSPPSQIRNYRYQDEMRGMGMTLDLAATLPMTPFVEELERTAPILTSETKESPPENGKRQPSTEDGQKAEKDSSVLDLLYDPVLNCYYDPKTHNYYELA